MRALLPLLVLVACGGETAPAPQQPAPPQPAPAPMQKTAVSAGQVDMVALKNGTADVPGRFETVSGDIEIDPMDLSRTKGTLTIALSSWNSDLELRDDRMKATFFGVETTPAVSFELTGIDAPSGTLDATAATATGTAKGKLHWRAVERELALPVELTRTADQAYTVAVPTFEISIASLDMSEPLKALMLECEHESIGDSIKVDLSLALGQQPAAATPPPAAVPVDAGTRVLKAAPRPMDKTPAANPARRLDGTTPATPAEGGGSRTLKKSGE